MRVVLLTAPDCHLCGHARSVLDELGVPWREVDGESDEGRELAAGAPPLRPLLFAADGRVVAYGRLSLKRLCRIFGIPRTGISNSVTGRGHISEKLG